MYNLPGLVGYFYPGFFLLLLTFQIAFQISGKIGVLAFFSFIHLRIMYT